MLKDDEFISMEATEDGEAQEVEGILFLRDISMSQDAKYSVKASNSVGSVKCDIHIGGTATQIMTATY